MVYTRTRRLRNDLNKAHHHVRWALACWLLIGLQPLLNAPTAQAEEGAFRAQHGMVVIEAEHYAETQARNGTSWQALRSSSAVGSAVEAAPSHGFVEPGKGADLRYRINFERATTYYVWIRARASSSDHNSVYIGFDGHYDGVHVTANDAWSWGRYFTEWNGTAQIEAEKGVHDVLLSIREGGAQIDRFLLTDDPDYRPSGSGPPESPFDGDPPPEPPEPPDPPAPPPPTGDHPLGCRDDEYWLDAQSWWTRTPGKDGNDFGHLHTGTCFPYQARFEGTVTLRVRSVLHANPGRFRQIQVQLYQGDEANIAVLNLYFTRRLSACTTTGGTLTDKGETCTWWDTLRIDTRKARYDGEVQFRIRGFVAEPDGKEMRTSTSLHAYLVNGDREWYDRLYQDLNEIEARGWYTSTKYAASTMGLSNLNDISGVWKVAVRLRRGFEGIAVTSHIAALDSDFHHGQTGQVLHEGSGEYRATLTIDTRKLANGWHRLALRTDQAEPPTGSTNSAVLMTYFKVDN